MRKPLFEFVDPVLLMGGVDTDQEMVSEALTWAKSTLCADGGADRALAAGLDPVAVIGDMDSISDTAREAFASVLYPISEQDSTDFDKALRHIKAPLVFGVGFSGGRLDHEVGSLTVLAKYPERRCILIGEETITLLCPPRLSLDLDPGTPVSLFPMAETGCDSTGLHWPTAGIRFAPDGRIGTLNRADGPVELRPEAPKMLVMLPRALLGLTVEAVLQTDARWPALVE